MLERAHELIEKILDGTLKLIDDSGSVIGVNNIFTASTSNEYDGTNKRKGEVFTLEDEKFHAGDPTTGYGATH
jgi:nucleoside-diphosphate-sugar epimerase